MNAALHQWERSDSEVSICVQERCWKAILIFCTFFKNVKIMVSIMLDGTTGQLQSCQSSQLSRINARDSQTMVGLPINVGLIWPPVF